MHFHTKQVNMLEGPLTGKIVRFAIPLACASVLQQLFNSADLAVIGRFENATAMAAVGSNAAIVSLLVSLFSGLSLGSNVTVASLIGMKKHEEVNRAVHTCVALSLICGVIICVLGEVIAPQILKVTSVPANVLPLATLYLRILFFALPFLIIYDFGTSVLRAKGDSTRPLYVLFVSGIMNVILNIIFVALFHLSVAGVAIATMISNMFSAFTILFFLRHEEPEFMISMKKLRIEKQYLKRIIGIGAPAGIRGMVFSLFQMSSFKPVSTLLVPTTLPPIPQPLTLKRWAIMSSMPLVRLLRPLQVRTSRRSSMIDANASIVLPS